MSKINLGIIGAGYVGLTTAVCLASIGHKINVYDVNKIKIQKLKNKKIPFYEPGLQELFEGVISTGNLKISESLDDLTQNTDGSFICVGTPSHETKSIDLSQIIDSTNSLAESIRKNKKNNYVVIVRSTILPQTTRNTILPILENILSERKFGLCVMPEFLREGEAVSDFMNPDKIVIGYLNEESKEFAEMIFEYFRKSSHFITTNFETAEMIKYANNAFFSTLISFSNEIANISERIRGIDAFQVMAALVYDKRITMTVNDKKIVPYLTTYLLPGCGFGGSCFPKDVKALTQHALSINTNTPLLNAVLEINEERPQRIISLAEFLLGSLKGKQISILGLAFKPDTDDLRSSPAIEGIKILQQKGAKISAYDPKITPELVSELGITDIVIHKRLEECLMNSVLAILFTKWPEFAAINSDFLSKYMVQPLIIDGRGYLDKNNFKKNTYYKVGYVE